MIIPFNRDMASAPGAPSAQPMPSQTNLLMALAEMHKQGRFATSNDGEKPLPSPRKQSNAQ